MNYQTIIPDIRDLTQMRTGGQRTAFEIHICRNATIKSSVLASSGADLSLTFIII